MLSEDKTVTRDIIEFRRKEQMNRLAGILRKLLVPCGPKRSLISKNYFTVPFYIPRVCRLCSNWHEYLRNYLLRKKTPANYRLRNGVRLIDDTGTLTGTVAVGFVRREYGTMSGFRTIVDIGAHVGIFAIYAAQSCRTPESIVMSRSSRISAC